MEKTQTKGEIRQDSELDMSGVTRVWRWDCNQTDCPECVRGQSYLFFENCVRGFSHHMKHWHPEEN